MKKTGLWKTGFVMMGMLLAIHMAGCSLSDNQKMQQKRENADKRTMKRSESEEKAVEEILEICGRTYREVEKKDSRNDLYYRAHYNKLIFHFPGKIKEVLE